LGGPGPPIAYVTARNLPHEGNGGWNEKAWLHHTHPFFISVSDNSCLISLDLQQPISLVKNCSSSTARRLLVTVVDSLVIAQTSASNN